VAIDKKVFLLFSYEVSIFYMTCIFPFGFILIEHMSSERVRLGLPRAKRESFHDKGLRTRDRVSSRRNQSSRYGGDGNANKSMHSS
jgi:hypothetical protein